MNFPLPHAWFDWFALLFLLWSILRGWRRGFQPELYNLLGALLVLLLLAGVSLVGLIWGSLDRLVHDHLRLSRLIGWLVVMGFMIYLSWKIRRWLTDLKKRRSRNSLGGLFGGVLGGLAWLLVMVVVARLLPLEVGGVLYSTTARLLRPLVGLIVQ